MENYPPSPYFHGDMVPDMAPEQSFWNHNGEGMSAYNELSADAQDYALEYYRNAIDPTGDTSHLTVDLGFPNYPYNICGGIPSPPQTVPGNGITVPGTPLGILEGLNSPQPQAIGPRGTPCRLEGCLVGDAMGKMSHTGCF
ncbi:hypothetical protein PG994_004474 [Apiospora phragmitis]|uniref:Uncharacterized protein n=1 Tax=Apiospora phragmitis TaxID=2905665 RepID=A0ABR1VQP7_9PEZI